MSTQRSSSFLLIYCTLVALLLGSCRGTPTATMEATVSEKEQAFLSLFPFELNSTLEIQVQDDPFLEVEVRDGHSVHVIREFPKDFKDFVVINKSLTPVWFPSGSLGVRMFAYRLDGTDTWTEISNKLRELEPRPILIGQPPFPVGSTGITIPDGVLPQDEPTEIRVIVVGYFADTTGAPTAQAVGAFTDIIVVDER